MARRLCLSVYLPPKLFCLQEDLQHEANQGAVPVVSWPSSELGCLSGSCRDEASFLACLRLFHFWTRYPGQLKHFSAQFCWHFGSALLRALSYKKDPGRLCMLSSLLMIVMVMTTLASIAMDSKNFHQHPIHGKRNTVIKPLSPMQSQK